MNKAGFDYERAVAAAGRLSILRNIAGILKEEAPKNLSALRLALDAGDANGAADVAHRIKGSVACFAADRAREAAARVEGTARAGDLVLARNHAETLDFEVRALVVALEGLPTSDGGGE